MFVMKRQGEGLAPSTISKYRTFIKQLTAFADRRGYVFVDQFNVDDVDVFYATWALSPRTKSKRLSTLRAFFRFCAARRWLIENPVSYDLKPPKGASRAANKAPFSDEEVERIIKRVLSVCMPHLAQMSRCAHSGLIGVSRSSQHSPHASHTPVMRGRSVCSVRTRT